MATTKHIYVDPDATGSADGTSWANAYTSLDAAQLAEATDITLGTGTDELHHYHCRSSSGGDDVITQQMRFGENYTFDESNGNRVIIEACGDEIAGGESNHNGVLNTSLYLLTESAYNGVIFGAQGSAMDIIGVQIVKVTTGTYSRAISLQNGHNNSTAQRIVRVERCILKGPGATTSYGVYVNNFDQDNVDSEVWVVNNMIYDWGQNIYTNDNGAVGQEYYLNNSLLDAADDNMYLSTPNARIINNVAYGATNSDFYGSTRHASSDYNANDDGTNISSNYVDLTPYAGTDIFEDYANDDFHAKTTGPLYQAATALTAYFTDDIDLQTRAATWTIGADDPDGTTPGGGGGYTIPEYARLILIT